MLAQFFIFSVINIFKVIIHLRPRYPNLFAGYILIVNPYENFKITLRVTCRLIMDTVCLQRPGKNTIWG